MRTSARHRRGFTLLEVLVATVIMGIAVVALLSGVSASLRNASRVTDYDRAVLVARAKMDALLSETRLPKLVILEGPFDAALMGGVEAGWRAQATVFDAPRHVTPGILVLERVELEVWWMAGSNRRKIAMEGFRRHVVLPGELGRGGGPNTSGDEDTSGGGNSE
jgi:general secretion pathway protein I